MVYIG